METNVNFEASRVVVMDGIEIEIQCVSIDDYEARAKQHGHPIQTRAGIGFGNDVRDGRPVILISMFHPEVGVMTGVLGEQSIDMLAHKIADHISADNAAIKRRNATPPRLVQ